MPRRSRKAQSYACLVFEGSKWYGSTDMRLFNEKRPPLMKLVRHGASKKSKRRAVDITLERGSGYHKASSSPHHTCPSQKNGLMALACISYRPT